MSVTRMGSTLKLMALRAAPVYLMRRIRCSPPIGKRVSGTAPPISPGDEVANTEEPAERSLPGLVNGLPMQYWPTAIFRTDR